MTLDIASIVAPAGKALAPVTGSTLSDAWQAIIGDRVAAWRISNAAKLQAKVHAVIEESGLKTVPTKIPERYASTWFEEATKQDEPEIQDLFATLLAQAAAGDKDALDRRHIETLSRFTPLDAVVMRSFYTAADERPRQATLDGTVLDPDYERVEWEFHRELKEQHGPGAWQTVEHLTVLGVFERRIAVDRDSMRQLFSHASVDRRAELSLPWHSNELELQTLVGATESGWSLHRALKNQPRHL